MGIHRQRLRASNAQRFFNAQVKAGLQKWAVKKYGREIPIATISPSTIKGVKPLSIPVPPMLEEALGYRGDLRFVEFGYSPKTRRFGYCDGADHIPSDQDLWTRFLRHPLIARHLPKSRYPTLHGVFPRNYQRAIDEFFANGSRARFPTPHRLLLDRKERRLYVCRTDHTLLFFALKEPENEGPCRMFVDGLLMSPGCKNYKVPVPREVAAELLGWLDNHLKSTN
ncbi:MAG TPA: hypothetical protein VGR84_01850 [Candidatus Acidoferrales bacterium]|nr:hypothetical protein [Candidatus Acidoferrales bacterium]